MKPGEKKVSGAKPQESIDDMLSKPAAGGIIRMNHMQYIHILDRNSNTKKIVVGPQNFILQ